MIDWGKIFEDIFKRKSKKETIKIVEKIIYKDKPLFNKQKSIKTINGIEIKENVKDQLGKMTFNKADALYKLVDIKHLKVFLAQNNISKRKYITNDHDCDDFSFELMGAVSTWDSYLAFGICWGNTKIGDAHAWNWCIGIDKKIWFIEPQTNEIFKPTKEKLWFVLM